MNVLQNNEVIDVANVAKTYQGFMLQIIFQPLNTKLQLISM